MKKHRYITALLLCQLLSLPCLSYSQQVKISGFTNIPLTSWTGSGDVSGQNSLCVYNSLTTDYKIRARGDGPGNSFALNSSGEQLPYEVRFKDQNGSYVTLTADSFQDFNDANSTDPVCSGLKNANLEVIVKESDLSSIVSGSYSGTLTILLMTR